jgi:hypothetical protein
MFQQSSFDGVRINNAIFQDKGKEVTVSVDWEVGNISHYNSIYLSWAYDMTLTINGVAYGQMAFSAGLPAPGGLYKETKTITLPANLQPVKTVKVNMVAYWEPGNGYYNSADAKPAEVGADTKPPIVVTPGVSIPIGVPVPTPKDKTPVSPVAVASTTASKTGWLLPIAAIVLLLLFSGKKK